MESAELILKNIAKIIELNEQEKELFISKLKLLKIKAKTTLVKKGDVADKTYFVNSGCVRAFTSDGEGTEYSVYFAPKDYWISEMYSYFSGNPSEQCLETVLPSEIVYFEKPDQEELFIKIPKLERFFRILIERSVVSHQQRIIDNLTKTAEERYVNFEKKYASIVHEIPQKQIASYIGVTPEFFSKMKARMLRGK